MAEDMRISSKCYDRLGGCLTGVKATLLYVQSCWWWLLFRRLQMVGIGSWGSQYLLSSHFFLASAPPLQIHGALGKHTKILCV